MSSVTVFTSVIGRTDVLRRPLVVSEGVRYVCVTDQPLLHVPPYEMVLVPPVNGTSRLLSRQIKILANHEALHDPEITLWHDASFRLNCNIWRVIERELPEGVEMCALRHPHRDQIEDEAKAIAKLGYAPAAVVTAQAKSYRAEGFQQDRITSTGFCLRRHTDRVRAFNAAWWAEVSRWQWRDQMSVDYAMWKTGLTARYLVGHYRNNPYARWYKQR